MDGMRVVFECKGTCYTTAFVTKVTFVFFKKKKVKAFIVGLGWVVIALGFC